MEAYLSGLEQLAERPDADLSQVASVASFFISRVDTEVDRRLEAIGTRRGAGPARQGRRRPGQARLPAVPSRRSAASAGTRSPHAAPGCSARCGRRTSTKNPAYPDTLYVDELIGPDTVNTLPDATLEAFADHGTLARTRRRRRRRGRGGLGGAGRRRRRHGRRRRPARARGRRRSFKKSFDELIDALETKAELELR